MYQEQHGCCSVLLGRIRNAAGLSHLSPKEQFAWQHHFYCVMDRVIEQHQVYKLYGGPQGFMVSSGVAEPDVRHAATLLRCALHLHTAARELRLPCGAPVDLCLSLASGEAYSGLLGTASLTYQIVGRCVQEAQQLLDSQPFVPLLIAGSMHQELGKEVTEGLVRLGAVALRGWPPGEEVGVYSLPRFGGMVLAR